MLAQFWRLLALLLLLRASIAVPVDISLNSTQTTVFVGYVSEPNVRGTTTLVLSCLLTLILCVWSALHLNVPQQDASRVQRMLCNIRWIITGVYAPELVVFTAWRQWASARLLGQLVTEVSGEFRKQRPAVPPSTPALAARQFSTLSHRTLYNSTSFAEHRHKWTKTHDFFASTGGFAFEVPRGRIHQPFLPKTCPTRLTLTARGVALLAKCNRLPDVQQRDILDKSKANDMAKALVVVQASWMLLQTLGRLIVALPVTLLEINTVAHVACVFVIYMLWWDKPLLPNEPFIVDGDWVEPLCAYMYMSSNISGEVEKKELNTMVKTLSAYLSWYVKTPEIESVALRLPSTESVISEETEDEAISAVSFPALPAFQSTSASQSCLDGLRAKQLEQADDTAFFERRPKVKGADLKSATPSSITRRRWALALEAINEYPVIMREQVLFRHDDDNNTCVHFKPEELLVPRVQNWPSNDLLRDIGGLMVGMVLWMASLAYGAIHAAAWNDHFPSETEQWIWRASAIYIGFCGGLWIVLNYLAQAYRPLNEFWERWMEGKVSWYVNGVIGFLVVLCGSSFCLARLYIVVEAVISIRSLPAEAYLTPDWTRIFPHF